MRENRTYGSEGGEANLPDPYQGFALRVGDAQHSRETVVCGMLDAMTFECVRDWEIRGCPRFGDSEIRRNLGVRDSSNLGVRQLSVRDSSG